MGLYKLKINFEKGVCGKLSRLEFRKIAIWSLIRVWTLNECVVGASKTGDKVNSANGNPSKKYLSELGIFSRLVLGIFQKKYNTFIFVNSFSVKKFPDQSIGLINKNLQVIYAENASDTIIFINNLKGWDIGAYASNAYIIPKIPPLIVKLFHSSLIAEIAIDLKSRLKLERLDLYSIIKKRILYIYFWKFIFWMARPNRILFECPQNSLESEVIAAKISGIKTIEIYHGLLNLDEPSYYQKHLDFTNLHHSVCDEFITPSARDRIYLKSINDKYLQINTIEHISSFKSDVKRHRFIYKNKPTQRRVRKIVFIATIADNDIEDIKNYILKNTLNCKKNKIMIRMHPNDYSQRWARLFRRFPALRASSNSLNADIRSADLLIVQSQTVALDLHAAGINFENIGRNALNLLPHKSKRAFRV